jgi:hypothetical protein
MEDGYLSDAFFLQLLEITSVWWGFSCVGAVTL